MDDKNKIATKSQDTPVNEGELTLRDSFEFRVHENQNILYDFKKSKLDPEKSKEVTKRLLHNGFTKKTEAMVIGERLNFTENQQVLHYLLRGEIKPSEETDQIKKNLRGDLVEMEAFDSKFNSLKSIKNQQFKRIVNIGIGGSDLGPKLIVDALSAYKKREVHFFSNVDTQNLLRQFEITPEFLETTFFIVVSKSWTTAETLNNMKFIVELYTSRGYSPVEVIKRHFAAVTAHKSPKFTVGFADTACADCGRRNTETEIDMLKFNMYDFVGGRYSLWSTVGLSIVLGLGFDTFISLLAGAHVADLDFFENGFNSVAVRMAYNDILSPANNKCIVAYDANLELLHKYLQQAEMESNGKMFSHSKIIWGGVGTDVQHSFFQYLHQCDTKIHLELLVPCNNPYREHCKSVEKTIDRHHDILVANALAQTKAMKQGSAKDDEKLISELPDDKKFQSMSVRDKEEFIRSIKCIFKGNKPSNTIMYSVLTPRILGFIIATYEHKIFTEGIYYGVNSFDQYGVQLGKKLALEIGEKEESDEDTKELYEWYLKNKHNQ